MPTYSGSGSFSSRSLYKLYVTVTTSEVTGGTRLYVTSYAARTGSETRTPYSLSGGSATRSYSVPGGRISSITGSLRQSDSLSWVFDFRPAGSSSSSNPYNVTVWGGFTRFIPYSYGSSTTVTIGANYYLMGSASASTTVSLYQPDPPPPRPEIDGSYSSGTVNVFYSDFVDVDETPVSWSRSGSLPPGLSPSISTSRYTVSGYPSSAGTYSFTLTATNDGGFDQESKSITIAAPPAPNWSDLTFARGQENIGYSDTISATNATSVSGTGAPPGMSLVSVNSSTLRLQGTPTSSGTFNMTVTANGQSGTTADVETATVTIDAATPPSWSDQTIDNNFVVGTSYSDQVIATNSPTYSISSGKLPAGISLNSSNGTLSGTPTAKETYSFTIQASNVHGSITASFSGTTSAPPLWIDDSLANFVEDVVYTDGVQATSLTNPSTSYAVTAGALPSGISLDTSSGALTGTPSAQAYSFTITASNPDGSITADFSGSVLTPPVWIDEEITNGFIENVTVSDTIEATNSPTYTLQSGSVPTGISFDPATAKFTGTPTILGEPYNFTIRASNSDGTADSNFSGTVQQDLGGRFKVYQNGGWVEGFVYVYDGASWNLGRAYVYDGSFWQKTRY